jgi:hypothetical protein
VNFIINEFGFSNYFKQGKTVFLNRKDLVALSKELKDRNVNLGRYIEFKQSYENFKKKVAAASIQKKATKKSKSYQVPDAVKDIETSATPMPSIDLVKDDIKKLKEEFVQGKLGEYIDIYRDSYAMMKTDYMFLRYRDKVLGARCRKWCDNFNYANHALDALK